MPHFFLQLSSILVLATFFGIIARLFRQPLILAYIFTGIIISLTGFLRSVDQTLLVTLSNFGLAFLLFLVGIELRIDDLKSVGKAAFYTGIGQILFTATIGYILIAGMGFSSTAAIYMAVAFTFSSTVIIVKLLAEKNDLNSLYGKIVVGVLLVQDFVAILALMILSGFGTGSQPGLSDFVIILLKGAFLVLTAILATKFFLKNLFRITSSNMELLFLAAVSWAFLFAAFAEQMGFSIAIGAFLAGISIGSSPYRIQISARVKPLRDFFLVIFFILLGVSLSFDSGGLDFKNILLLSLFILLGKPLIVMAVMMTLKFRNRTSFMASVAVAQISEFSLILLTVAQNLGQVGSRESSVIAAVGIVTITLSSYLILYGEKIYQLISGPMARLFPEKLRDPYVVNRESLKDHIVLVGGEQMGSDILEFLKGRVKDKEQLVVVDFNPEIYKGLKATGYNAVFGDVSDPEVLEELELGRARLLIITDPDVGDTIHIIAFAKGKNFKGPIIGTAYWIHEAIKLYEMGADYVVVPETVGGKHISKILSEHWEELSKIKKEKSKHFEDLVSRKIF